jgi:Lar family restriction alleviation protein
MIWETETRAKLARKCPFCGCELIKTQKPEWIEGHEIQMVTIECDECGAQVSGHADHPDFKKCYAIALKRWNRRAS